jgi:predicted Holliday junction resolvase-like endonuclease
MNYLNIMFILGTIAFILFFIVLHLFKENKLLKEEMAKLQHSKKSVEVRHGKTWEEFVPFLNDFPYTKENFKFIGMPIDGIAFEEDKIAFVEIKTGKSRMSEKQRRVKELVQNKKVEFKELRY